MSCATRSALSVVAEPRRCFSLKWGVFFTGFAVAHLLPDYLTGASLPALDEEHRSSSSPFAGHCVSLQGTRFVMRIGEIGAGRPPAKKGYIFVNLAGDATIVKRRQQARLRILANQTGVPVFSWLEGMPVTARRWRRHNPLSGAARAHFGKTGPNERQVQALDIALNTPDIALIQGPPGTGKTRTIAALLTRLSEIAEAEERESDKNLLTSFQHDAVENAAAISSVNGLPAIKIGRRRGSEDDSELAIKKWRQQQIEYLQDALAHRTDRPKKAILSELRSKRVAYLASPGSDAGTAAMLAEVRAKASRLISAGLDQDLQVLIWRLKRHAPRDDAAADLVAAVRGLRTTETAFGDDGPRSAFRLLRRLEQTELLNSNDRVLLRRAQSWSNGESLDFVGELLGLRDRLLDTVASTKPKTFEAQVNADVAELLDQAVTEVEAKVAESPDEGIDLVLERLLHDITHGQQELRETLGRYTVVLAATCQQSVGKRMLEHLQSDDDFATVIVDEAARANPLDLMIPMSRARRRIILVGDHRQLPHMLEPDIERELDKSLRDDTRDAMKKSLFQRLFEQTKAQEARDGIKRYVTLNAQYRMHPTLGHFVSRVFYQRHGGDEAFDSPGEASSFAHSLSGVFKDKCAAWKNIPLASGAEERCNPSWRRRSEAIWIAEEARRILDECPSLSVGVISFYSAQVHCILQAMLRTGLAEPDEANTFKVASAYKHTTNRRGEPIERLRVGTVDAFQGKEFDIVILSMTRANSHRADSPALLRRKFGHLLLENRLCVAMSRQRQLLIVVGDRDMLSTPEASDAVPGLAEFSTLCLKMNGAVF